MQPPIFTLVVVSTADGFIAQHPGHAPSDWASPEEQAVFLREVDAADWGILGRGTHEAADKPHRRRIVFSSAATVPDWRRDRQVWIDPAGFGPVDLAPLVSGVYPLRHGLVLGGTAVHDWFHRHRALSSILLTVEPVTFGAGLPIFSGLGAGDPVVALSRMGYAVTQTRSLNDRGTRLVTLAPAQAFVATG